LIEFCDKIIYCSISTLFIITHEIEPCMNVLNSNRINKTYWPLKQNIYITISKNSKTRKTSLFETLSMCNVHTFTITTQLFYQVFCFSSFFRFWEAFQPLFQLTSKIQCHIICDYELACCVPTNLAVHT